MDDFKAGEQVWVLLEVDDNIFEAVDPTGVLETVDSPVAVIVAPATVLEDGGTAELTDGTEIKLLPGRTFHTIEEAEEAAEAFAG